MSYKKKDGIDPRVSSAAAIMGRKGGLSRSERKLEAIKKRIKKGGRPPVYHFDKKTKAIFGIRNPQVCIIPDEVADDPVTFMQRKQFPAYCNSERIFVCLVNPQPVEGFHVKRPDSRNSSTRRTEQNSGAIPCL